MPPSPLFVYGTLRDPDLLRAVLGHPLDGLVIVPATAPGFAAVHYPRRPYPALVRTPGGSAEGLLILRLSPFDLDVLDSFEGPEYRRDVVPVIADGELHEATAYLPAIAIAADAPPWTLDDWQRLHKPGVLAGESSQAAAIRERLVLIRPN